MAQGDGTPLQPGDNRDFTTITYGTGKLTGEYIRDGLCLGDGAQKGSVQVCTTVDFLGVTQESRFPFSELPFDGILGLGLSGLSAGPTFNLVTRLKANGTVRDPVFAVFLRDREADEDSEITFGGYRPERLARGEEGLSWLPVPRDEADQKGYWLVTMRDIFVRGEPLGLCGGAGERFRCQVAMDTGSSFTMGPPLQVAKLLRAIGSCEQPLPSLRLQFDAVAGGTFDMVLTGEDYAEASEGSCAFAIQAMELPPTLGPMWVLGQTALRRYYSVYDALRWRVGVGLAWHTAARRAPAPSVMLGHPGEACVDDDENMVWKHLPGCSSFAGMGYCQRFAPLAHRYCRLSCELCTPTSTSGSTALDGAMSEDDAGAHVQGDGFRVSREQRGVVKKGAGVKVRGGDEVPRRRSWLLS
uniref:Peptidase A1 domain-containing protein n=1 Tax=Pyrodinium bahamense TaxID=73915 RepID=A0A7R9ZVL9_9DINO